MAEFEGLLLRLGAHELRHSGRTLFDHLVGTARLLVAWGCSEPVCAAGLFHSVYGTSAFRRSLLDARDRPALRRRIGYDAEELVYLFCRARRPAGLIDAFGVGSITDRETKIAYKVSPEIAERLALIECANLYEQYVAAGLWSDRTALDVLVPHLGAAWRLTLEAQLAGSRVAHD